MFAAKVDLTDVASGAQIIGNTKDLSFSGFRVRQTIFVVGAKVRVRILYRGDLFVAFGRVARTQSDGDTGIEFTSIEAKDRETLDGWLAQPARWSER